jgi:hypothetical protein
MSALPPKADMCGAARDVRFGPKADTAAHLESSKGGAYLGQNPIADTGSISIESSSVWAELFARDNCEPSQQECVVALA